MQERHGARVHSRKQTFPHISSYLYILQLCLPSKKAALIKDGLELIIFKKDLFANLPFAHEYELRTGQFLDTHWAIRMKLGSGNADLGTKT